MNIYSLRAECMADADQLKKEWHLLWFFRMPVKLYVAASLGARHLQPRVGLGSSLSHSRLDASGPMAHPALGDQCE